MQLGTTRQPGGPREVVKTLMVKAFTIWKTLTVKVFTTVGRGTRRTAGSLLEPSIHANVSVADEPRS